MKDPLEKDLIKNLIRVTLRCNANCVFCNIPPESEPDFKEHSEESLLQHVKLLASKSRGGVVVFSGGEPTLHPCFLKAVEEAKKEGVKKVEIQTNGLIITNQLASSMRNAGIDQALVAILSKEPEIHDSLTGVKGSWKKTINSIHLMHKTGIGIILNLLMTGPTTKTYPQLVRFCIEEFPFVREVNFSAVSATGRCESRPDLWPDYDEARPVIFESIEIVRRSNIRCINPFCGLPVCAGWEKNLNCCVEATEMRLEKISRGKRTLSSIEGLKNLDEKIHPPVCFDCCYRTFCSGIWKQIFRVRGEKGLQPPLKIARPFFIEEKEIFPLSEDENRRTLLINLQDVKNLNDYIKIIERNKLENCWIAISLDIKNINPPSWLPDAVYQTIQNEEIIFVQIIEGNNPIMDLQFIRDLITGGTNEFLFYLWSVLPPIHNSILKQKNSFENTIKAIKKVSSISRDVTIVLGAPLIPRTIDEIESYLLLCEKLLINRLFLIHPGHPSLFPLTQHPSPEHVIHKLNSLSTKLQKTGFKIFCISPRNEYGIYSYKGSPVINFKNSSKLY